MMEPLAVGRAAETSPYMLVEGWYHDEKACRIVNHRRDVRYWVRPEHADQTASSPEGAGGEDGRQGQDGLRSREDGRQGEDGRQERRQEGRQEAWTVKFC